MSDKHERGGVMAALNETVEGLHAAGIVDKQTMREFDALTLARIPDPSPEEMLNIREREHVGRAVFARSDGRQDDHSFTAAKGPRRTRSDPSRLRSGPSPSSES